MLSLVEITHRPAFQVSERFERGSTPATLFRVNAGLQTRERAYCSRNGARCVSAASQTQTIVISAIPAR